MVLKKEINRDDFYISYYTSLNGILNLTKKQLQALAVFSNIYSEQSDAFTEDQKDTYTFSSSSREIVCERLSITNYNLNNIIRDLKNRNVIIAKDKGYKLNPFLYKSKKEDEININFKFILK